MILSKNMKKVLFLGVTKYDLEKDSHLRRKFEPLSKAIKPYVVAKGQLCHVKKWGAEFLLLPAGIFYWPMAFVAAFWFCLVKKIDTVVCQGPLVEGLAGTILKKIFKNELIVELHGDWGFKKNLSKIAPISLKNADKIRGVATYLIEKAKKIAPQKPYYLFPTFTDLDDFLQEENTSFQKYILFVGRDDVVKGIKYLQEAYELIKADFPEFTLILVGEGLPEGKLSLQETRKKMKDCYCLVVPSLTEGLPRVIMEAMALAKPIVASNVGGIPDLVKDGQTGFLCRAGHSRDLTEKLRILLSNQDLAMEMGRRGKEIIQQNFSNEKYISNYLAMINQ